MPSAYVAVSHVVSTQPTWKRVIHCFHYIRVLLGNRESELCWRVLALVTILLFYITLYLVLNAYIIY